MQNYTRLTDVRVDHRLVNGAVLDANGDPLVLEELWVSNADLIAALNALNRDLRRLTTSMTRRTL